MTLAEDLFTAQAQLGFVEDRLGDVCEAALGASNWDDFDYDPTDCSVEIYGVPVRGYDLSPLFDAGFRRVWLHVGAQRRQEGERYFSADGRGGPAVHGADAPCNPVAP